MADEQTVEQRAREQGWKPKEEYTGDATRWVDAETYVKRGEEILPILKANDSKHRAEISDLRVKVMTLEGQLKASQESIDALKEFNSEAARAAAKAERRQLIAAVEAARKEGNVEEATRLSEQLEEHNDAIRTAETAVEKKPKEPEAKPNGATAPQESAAYRAWKEANPWFGTDTIKSDVAVAVSMRLRRDPATKDLAETDFLRRVTEETEKATGGNPNRRGESKTDSGRPSAGGAGGSGASRSYHDLPREAQEACDRFAKRLVGKGKAWESVEAYRKHYVETFDWSA
jgi:hypothetical protein